MAKKKKYCTCAEQVNKLLAEHNTRLPQRVTMNFTEKVCNVGPSVEIVTEKIDQKKRMGPKTVFGSHCPFCGKKNGR